jgi:hypothetical protein
MSIHNDQHIHIHKYPTLNHVSITYQPITPISYGIKIPSNTLLIITSSHSSIGGNTNSITKNNNNTKTNHHTLSSHIIINNNK